MLPIENGLSGVGGWTWRPLQVFLETQFERLTDGCDDVLRQSTSAFEDVTSSAVHIVFGHVGDEIQGILF